MAIGETSKKEPKYPLVDTLETQGSNDEDGSTEVVNLFTMNTD